MLLLLVRLLGGHQLMEGGKEHAVCPDCLVARLPESLVSAGARDCKATHVDAVAAGIQDVATRPGATTRAGAAPGTVPAIDRAARRLHLPPPRDCADLESMIAVKIHAAPDQVVVGHGSTEVMDWLFRMQSRSGGTVVATEPTFELYRTLADWHELDYVSVPWDPRSFNHDLPALIRAIDDRTAVCVLDLPHSVSGAPARLTDVLDHLAPRLPEGARLLVDLVYADFMASPPTLSAELLDGHPNVLLCGSLSKAHCLLGARVGYGVTAAPLAAQLRHQRLPYAIDVLALAAAEAALTNTDHLRCTVEANRAARVRLTTVLDEHGIAYVPSDANFMLINLGTLHAPVVAKLQDRGARFRDGRRWHLPGWIQTHLIDASIVEPLIEAIQLVDPGRLTAPRHTPTADTFTKGHPTP